MQQIPTTCFYGDVLSGFSLESPQLGNSDEQPQHMFLWKTGENYPQIIIKYPPYLFF